MSWKKGQWKIICDVCGWEFLSSEIRKRWDGLLVDKNCFEHDHPQKYLRVQSDPKPLPSDWIRTEPTDTFVAVCTAYTSQAIAGIGIPGCIIPSRNNNLSYNEYGSST